ncbi:hypothetical protein J6590_011493 [Homalodisca vitripennis]|nr:hypothetical protein J6590_011493 [Homalodisca vitripennis]
MGQNVTAGQHNVEIRGEYANEVFTFDGSGAMTLHTGSYITGREREIKRQRDEDSNLVTNVIVLGDGDWAV